MNGSRLIAGMLSLLLLPGLLTACGFHFRQAPDLPPSMRHIYIAAPGSNGSLLRELRRDLTSDNTEILPTPLGATTTLSIIGVTQSSQPLALDLSGQPLEYQVTYHVEFSLLVQGATILEPQTVDLKRNYTYNIANEEQEQSLAASLSRDVAQFIVYRVIAAARSLPPSLAAIQATAPPAAVAVPVVPAPITTSAPVAATHPPAV